MSNFYEELQSRVLGSGRLCRASESLCLGVIKI